MLSLHYYLDLIKIRMVAVTTSIPQPAVALQAGSVGTVARFNDERLGSKLLAMGVLPGSRLEILRAAPFGGGVVVKIDDHLLALRKEELLCIILK